VCSVTTLGGRPARGIPLTQGLLNANSRNGIGEISHLLNRWGHGLRICELKLLSGCLFLVKRGRQYGRQTQRDGQQVA